jgi:protein TonB
MEVVYCIIGLVALISIYDYFTTRSWQMITSVDRNEIVFQKRNREFGAYTLRSEYDKRLIWVMFSFMLGLSSIVGSYMIYKNWPEEQVVEKPKDNTQFTTQAPPIEEDVPPPPPEEPPPPMEKSIAFMPPVVVDIPVEDQIPIQEDMDDTKASTTTNEDGVDFGGTNFVEPDDDDGPAITEPEKEDKIYTFVDEEPEFPGGYQAMMAYIQKNFNYPQVAIENNIQGKAYVKFVVKGDGTVSQVQIERGIPGCPECDKEAKRVVNGMPGWKAGKVNGKSVSSVFRLPITFELE